MPRSAPEQIISELRQHGIVLAGSLLRALFCACAGTALVAIGWPYSAAGLALMLIAALVFLRAVWRWDRTKLVVAGDRLYVSHGVLRRRSAAIRLSALETIELEQTLAGRLLGYGTLIVGDLEIDHVPEPGDLQELLTSLAGPRLAA